MPDGDDNFGGSLVFIVIKRRRHVKMIFITSPVLLNTENSITPSSLSKRPQVSVGYKLINHAGCWYNTRTIRKPRAACEKFTNFNLSSLVHSFILSDSLKCNMTSGRHKLL